VGLIPEDALARRSAAEAAAKQRSSDPAAWIALSQACQILVDEEGAVAAARRAYELQPENVNAIRQLATVLFTIGPFDFEARPLFERLLVLVPGDPTALHYLYHFAMFDEDYQRAIELLETLDRSHPGDPITAGRIARSYQLMGDPLTASERFARAAARCENELHPFPYYGPWGGIKPLLTALAGDAAASEHLSVQLCQEAGLGVADLSNPRYPKDSAASILRLQDCVGGRDLFVFGNGPSLEEITSRAHDVASLEFASMALSSFQIVDQDLLRPIGKRIELACLSHLTMLKYQEQAIRDWFATVPSSILILPLWLREYAELTGEPDFLLGRADRLFWFDCFSETMPPVPSDPLHFPAVNTLMLALGVGVLARPRRIFLFGFDGQIKGRDSRRLGALYYREDHEGYHHPRRNELEVRRLIKAHLRWNTLNFNELAPVVLRHAALLFDLPLPPIYNVCADSALTPFPRLTFARFREIVSSKAARQ
jgi:tetratricopeptide (TPR) repeat protein